MHTEVIGIEQHYQDLLTHMKKQEIDFWGINMTDSLKERLTYKIYQSQKISKNRRHPLIEYVHQREMLRYFSDVADSSRPEAVRIDISLYQRNDINIEGLLVYLAEYVPFFSQHVSEVKKIAEMKITNELNYRYASLYHVGLIENKDIPELLKFHFFTRWCENPNQHTKEGYRDNEFLGYLRDIGIGEYKVLAEKAADVLCNCGGHLWMAGMDIFPDKIKYKIYIKNICNAYEYFPVIVSADASEHLKNIAYWNKRHDECKLAGVAFALDTQNVSSLNLYYHVN